MEQLVNDVHMYLRCTTVDTIYSHSKKKNNCSTERLQ